MKESEGVIVHGSARSQVSLDGSFYSSGVQLQAFFKVMKTRELRSTSAIGASIGFARNRSMRTRTSRVSAPSQRMTWPEDFEWRKEIRSALFFPHDGMRKNLFVGMPFRHALLVRNFAHTDQIEKKTPMTREQVLFVRELAILTLLFKLLYEKKKNDLLRIIESWFGGVAADGVLHRAVMESSYSYFVQLWHPTCASKQFGVAYEMSKSFIYKLFVIYFGEKDDFFPRIIASYLALEGLSVTEAGDEILVTPALFEGEAKRQAGDIQKLLNYMKDLRGENQQLVMPLNEIGMRSFTTQGERAMILHAMCFFSAWERTRTDGISAERFIDHVNKELVRVCGNNPAIDPDLVYLHKDFLAVVMWIAGQSNTAVRKDQLLPFLQQLIPYVNADRFSDTLTNHNNLHVYWLVRKQTEISILSSESRKRVKEGLQYMEKSRTNDK